MKPTILDTVADRQLFAPWFRDAATWFGWLVFLRALFALPMTEGQLAVFTACTGRHEPPSQVAREAWLVCGRRAGKSFILALVAVFLACFHDYQQHLAPGERGTILVVAADRKQARVIIRYIRALLGNVPMLARMIERQTAEAFDLSNSVTIEVASASFRSTRGYTIVAALLDEVAFWPTDDAAQPDAEVINAIRPGMATIPNSMLLCASSPYSRRGSLWTAHRQHYGKDGDPVIVWQADTLTMNPTVPKSVIDEAYERDPASAAAEYGAQFRSDIEAFIAREAVEACVSAGVRERPPVSSVTYAAFVDPSGGSSDSMTCAIAHRERDTVVIDCLREYRPPFSPSDVTVELAEVLKSYRVRRVTGDRYAGEWCREVFRRHGIFYQLGAKPKSDLYVDLLPQINSRRIALLDNTRLVNQLMSLERRTARSGRDSIDHPPSAHDDLANVCAGVASEIVAAERRELPMATFGTYGTLIDEPVSEMRQRIIDEMKQQIPSCLIDFNAEKQKRRTLDGQQT